MKGLYLFKNTLLVYVRGDDWTGKRYSCYKEIEGLKHIDPWSVDKDWLSEHSQRLSWFQDHYPTSEEMKMLSMLDENLFDRVRRIMYAVRTGDWMLSDYEKLKGVYVVI